LSIAKSFHDVRSRLIDLEAKGKGEVLFWDVCEMADQFAQQKKYVSEEFDDLRRLLVRST
jgi:arginine decarboxylase